MSPLLDAEPPHKAGFYSDTEPFFASQQEFHPLKIFDQARKAGRPAHIAAPMVRYSKLPFRSLVRDYNVDLCYTPMILAKEFNRSALARDSDFTTSPTDRPLITQFATRSPLELSRAASLVRPYCDGIDINCGCPQSWACADGLGAQLMHERETVAEMVKAVKACCGKGFCVSVKIRVHADLRKTLDFITTISGAGADFITVHGRRRSQRSSEPVDLDAIKSIKQSATVSVVANGDAFSLADVKRIAEYTGVDGVMAARPLLSNPALFAGYDSTPWEAVEKFMACAVEAPIPFPLVQHHLAEMTKGVLGRGERRGMLDAGREGMLGLVDWFEGRGLG